jgi:hypothetical protein
VVSYQLSARHYIPFTKQNHGRQNNTLFPATSSFDSAERFGFQERTVAWAVIILFMLHNLVMLNIIKTLKGIQNADTSESSLNDIKSSRFREMPPVADALA